MIQLLRSKILVALSLLLLVLSLGTIGYRVLADFTWIEALYMTIITITTVGFSEIRPLDDTGRIFTIFLLANSIFILGFSISVVTEYILRRNFPQLLKKKKVKKKVEALSNHIILCGFGKNGVRAARRLKANQRAFVVVEKKREIVERHQDEVLFVEGDANEDGILIDAGIHRAQYLIAATPDDVTNLFIVLTARQLNPSLFIISRASQISSQKKLKLAGADKVIMPDKIGGDHMASLVVMPDLITFMNQLSMEGKHTTNLEEVEIEEFTDQVECHSLRDLDLRRRTGCTIIGYIAPDGEYIINPEPDLILQPKGKVIVLGRPEQIETLNHMFRKG